MNTPFKKDLILLSQRHCAGGDRLIFWVVHFSVKIECDFEIDPGHFFFIGNNNFMEKRLLGGLDTLFTTLIYQ